MASNAAAAPSPTEKTKGVVITSYAGDVKLRQVTIEAGKHVVVLPSNERPGFYRIETLFFPIIAGFIPCTHVRLSTEATTPSSTPKNGRKGDASELPRKVVEQQNMARAMDLVLGGKPTVVRKQHGSMSDGWSNKRSQPPKHRPDAPLLSTSSGDVEETRTLPVMSRSSGSRGSPMHLSSQPNSTAPVSPSPLRAPPLSPTSPKMANSPPVLVLPNAEEVHRHKVEVSKALEEHPPMSPGQVVSAKGEGGSHSDHRRARSAANFAGATSSLPDSPVNGSGASSPGAASPSIGRSRAESDAPGKSHRIMRRKSIVNLSSHVSKSDPGGLSDALAAHAEEKERLERYWKSVPCVFLAWESCIRVSARDPPLILGVKGFPVECGNEGVEVPEAKELAFVDETSRTPFYDDHMRLLPHFHWLFSASELTDTRDPVVISCEDRSDKEKTDRFFLVLVRADRGDTRFVIEAKEPRKWLKEHCKKTYPKLHMKKEVRELSKEHGEPFEKLCNDLAAFEKSNIVSTYKVGVLYWKEGQTENEAFSNQTSDAFDRFLGVLGTRITLNGWNRFKGGLNVTEEASTGKESVFSEYKGFQIMFHVSTMLPLHESDVQKLERKRHIGNDIVIVIFKEGNTPFDPTQLHTQFNHVFIVVEEVHDSSGDDELRYRVEVVTKPDVPCFAPRLPQEPIFKASDPRFREMLLHKIINGERAAMLKAKDFRVKMKNTRRALLTNIVDNFGVK